MTGVLDVAGILWRAFGRRADIISLAAEAKPFYEPVEIAYRAVMAAYQANPTFLKRATDLYSDVVGHPMDPGAPAMPKLSWQWIQETLNTLDGAGLVVDNKGGDKTDAAIAAYQKRKGLIVDELVGPDTYAAMMADLRAK